MVKKTGARYVIFTPNHDGINFPAPLREWEALHPGGTTKRDLIMDMANALNLQGIKLIMYVHVQTASDPNYTGFQSHTTNLTE
jgi:alpha-L-fucosidase